MQTPLGLSHLVKIPSTVLQRVLGKHPQAQFFDFVTRLAISRRLLELLSRISCSLQDYRCTISTVLGTALGGTPQNVTSVWDVPNKSPYSGMIALSSVGVVRLYPEAREFLMSQLKTEGPQNKTEFLNVEK